MLRVLARSLKRGKLLRGTCSFFAAVALGCASMRGFVPGEHVTGLSPDGGRPAAEYSVRSESHAVADVKVWSQGATRNTGPEDDGATVIAVGVEIDNRSDVPVRLDTRTLALEQVQIAGQTISRIAVLRVDGSPEVAAGAEGQLVALFRLPGDVYPSAVKGYRVAWTLANGGTYRQKTPFLAAAPGYAEDPWPYSYPYYYSPPPYYPFYYDAYPRWYWYRNRGWPGWRHRRYYQP
jgi:hypothetical protein